MTQPNTKASKRKGPRGRGRGNPSTVGAQGLKVGLLESTTVCAGCGHAPELHDFRRGCTKLVWSSGAWSSDGKPFEHECLCDSGTGM